MTEQIIESAPVSKGVTVIARLMSALPTFVVASSFVIQSILIALFIQYRDTPHGEGRAFAGMGLIMVLGASLWIVVPGTLIATVRVVRTLIGKRRSSNPTLSVTWNLFVAYIMPALVWVFILISDKPRPPPPPIQLSPADERVAGYVWAQDNNIEREALCKGSVNFVEGCVSAVRRRQPR